MVKLLGLCQLLGAGVVRSDGDGDALNCLSTADDFRGVASAEIDRTRKVKSGERLEDAGLSSTLVTGDDHLAFVSTDADKG